MSMIARSCAALMLYAVSLAAAAVEPVVLVVEESLYRIEPLLASAWMEPLQPDGRHAIWQDPLGRDPFNSSVTVVGGIPVATVSDQRRIYRMQEVASVVGAYGDTAATRAWLDPLIGEALARQGLEVTARYRARNVNHETVASTPARPDGQRAFSLQMDGFPLVGLSWDNRRVLVSFELKSYQRSRGKRVIERERSARVVRYASAPVPAAADPLAYWSEAGGARFRAEVERAFREGLDLAFAAEWPEKAARPDRKDIVSVDIGGRNERYRGRVWKRTDDGVLLQHHDGSISRLRLMP
jgi:hypothetical protein